MEPFAVKQPSPVREFCFRWKFTIGYLVVVATLLILFSQKGGP